MVNDVFLLLIDVDASRRTWGGDAALEIVGVVVLLL